MIRGGESGAVHLVSPEAQVSHAIIFSFFSGN